MNKLGVILIAGAFAFAFLALGGPFLPNFLLRFFIGTGAILVPSDTSASREEAEEHRPLSKKSAQNRQVNDPTDSF